MGCTREAALKRWATPGFREKARQSLLGHTVSKATRRKISKANKGKVAWNKGVPHSEQTKRKISYACKGKTLSVSHKKAIRKGNLARYRLQPSTLRGRLFTEETKQKMSIAQKRRFEAGYVHPPPTYKGFRYRGIWFRSSWELAFAKWLYKQGESFTYEKHRFILPGVGLYTPDFYLPRFRLFVEVKGYVRNPHFGDRLAAFLRLRPKRLLVVVTGKDLYKLGIIGRDQKPLRGFK